jgi:hypothetical protein
MSTEEPIGHAFKLHLIIADIGRDNQSRIKIGIFDFGHGG